MLGHNKKKTFKKRQIEVNIMSDAFIDAWFQAGGNVLFVGGDPDAPRGELCSKKLGTTSEELERKVEAVKAGTFKQSPPRRSKAQA